MQARIDSLKKKTILLISPQAWETMFLSKHHYAIELAKRGNRVYFLCPLDQNIRIKLTEINIKPSGKVENLFFIEHRLFFPFQLKFHVRGLFHFLMRMQLKRIERKINRQIDIIWSFDLGNFFPFKFFGKSTFRIFHPVDEPLNEDAIRSGKGADVLFSVTTEILDKYKIYNIPGYFINHGLADEFMDAPGLYQPVEHNKIHIGFSGNLRRNDIDRKVLLKIIKDNPGMIFECWGGSSLEKTNTDGYPDKDTISFIEDLRQQDNVILHGAVPTANLAEAIRKMDAFLICYDVNKDQSKGTNYHKVMEFIGTGKVIISNNISTYKNAATLVQMVAERTHNNSLPALFTKVTSDLSFYNSMAFREERISFAKANSYRQQVQRIENILCSSLSTTTQDVYQA